MINPVREANGAFAFHSHSEARYLLEKEIIARAFSRWFTIVRWKKPIFPVTCENKKIVYKRDISWNWMDGYAIQKENKHAPIGHFGWCDRLIRPYFLSISTDWWIGWVGVVVALMWLNGKGQTPRHLCARNRVCKALTSASKCGPTKTKFYTAAKSYFYGRRGFFAVTKLVR